MGANCLLGICCPPGSAEAKQSLTDAIIAAKGFHGHDCEVVASAVDWLMDNYDLAPYKSLRLLFSEIAKYARENP